MNSLKIINLYRKFFPEESYLIGLDKISNKDFLKENKIDKKFLERFYSHLIFYKTKLYSQAFEKIYKSSNIVFYHLLKNQKLDKKYLNKIIKLFKELNNYDFNLNEKLARKFFVSVVKKYLTADSKNKKFFERIFIKYLNKKVKNNFINPIEDFEEWQYNLYSLKVISKNELLKDALEIKRRIKKTKNEPQFDNNLLTNFFLNYFKKFLNVKLPPLKFINTPPSLKILIPTAAAYNLDRITRKPTFVVFIDFNNKSLAPSKLLFVLFHEIFGHVLHFSLVNHYCLDNFKILPYLSRFYLTEGFALLAEDFLFNIFKNQKILDDFEKNFPKFKNTAFNLNNIYLKYRLLRYIRYIFEIEVYKEEKDPYSAIYDLSKQFNLQKDFLKSDLTAFLFNPGYGSCYIGGYYILKKLGKYDDESFRKEIGKMGFDFLI